MSNTVAISDYLQSLRDIEAAIQFGIMPSEIGKVYHKFAGRVGINTSQVMISTCENENPFNTSGLQLYISSANISDTQEIFLEGVDQDYKVKSVSITLQGQTAVSIPIVFRTIWRGYNNNSTDLLDDVYVGSEATPINGVPAIDNQYAVINSLVNGKIVNQTLTSIFTVPDGYTGFVTRWDAVADRNDDIDFTAYGREQNKVFRYMERIQVFETSHQKELPYLKIPSKTDIKVLGASAKNNSNGSITYDLILLNNDYLQKMRRLNWR